MIRKLKRKCKKCNQPIEVYGGWTCGKNPRNANYTDYCGNCEPDEFNYNTSINQKKQGDKNDRDKN